MSWGEKLRSAVDRLRGGRVDKETVKESVKDIQRALIGADVEISTVLALSKQIEENAFGDLPEGVSRQEHVVKVTYDALVELLGGDGIGIPERPKRILLLGLFGQGKTTASAKIAKYYSKRGLSVGLIAADVFRPAAAEQLEQLGKKVGTPVFRMDGETNASKIVQKGLDHFKGKDLVIVDSAGRSGLDAELSDEIQGIQRVLNAEQVWLVMGADVGQLAKKQASAFHESVGVNGIVLTRTDGSAKGGGALAACHATKAPVLFLGTGEKVEDLEVFDATRYLSRVMGYGDLQSLLEKIQDVSAEEQLSPEEIFEKEFTLKTFYEQLKAARKMGPLGKVMELMGMSAKMPKEVLETGEKKMDGFKHLMDSMTHYEKEHPDAINHSRMVRIAKGSGHSEGEVRELLKQYKQMKDMLKEFKKMKDVDSPEEMQKSGGMQKLFSKMTRKQQKKKVKIR